MNFSKWVFRISGVYGLVVMAPQYFLEARIGHDSPPAITHPEYFYGFVGLTIAWQIAFLIISTNPARYRWLMLAAVVEKVTFVGAVAALAIHGRVGLPVPIFALIDLIWGILFIVAFRRTQST